MAPVGYTVGLIHNEQADPIRDLLQNPVAEIIVCQSFRRDQEDIDLVGEQSRFNRLPIIRVAGIDRFCPDADPIRSQNLVAHQCKNGEISNVRPLPWSRSSRVPRKHTMLLPQPVF